MERKEIAITIPRAAELKDVKIQIPKDIDDRLTEYAETTWFPKNIVASQMILEGLQKYFPEPPKKRPVMVANPDPEQKTPTPPVGSVVMKAAPAAAPAGGSQ